MKWILLISASLTLAACSNRPCRELRQPELASAQVPAPKPTPTVATPQASPAPQGGAVTAPKEGTVLVYKADGSLQCQQAKGVSVQEMEKQLAGIKVYSRDKRPDGLMHIQVCGSPTGMINVFEIDASNLAKAEAKGFKRFDPR